MATDLIVIENIMNERDVIYGIRNLIRKRKQTLQEAIIERELYFRLSVVSHCNLTCQFCHNEGAANTRGFFNINYLPNILKAVKEVGFDRLQLTGGEPLLNHEIARFVEIGRTYFPKVGITTNGTQLHKYLDKLIDSGLTKLHVSLQYQALRKNRGDVWQIPMWLDGAIQKTRGSKTTLRLNVPIPGGEISEAGKFLRKIATLNTDTKVFSILPEGNLSATLYPIEHLENIVAKTNEYLEKSGIKNRILLRGFRPPSGIRCSICIDFNRCKEQSHSLRLGSDLVLRPCLATRQWDRKLLLDQDLIDQIERATLFAIDYWW